jgi:hypothetical protein
MPEMLELIESLRREEADVQALFGGEGRRVSESRPDPSKLLMAARLMEKAQKSRRAAHLLAEAMSTSDFPILAADILDRQMLGFYEETSPTWQAYVRRSVVNDFRNVKRFAVDGAEGALDPVDQGEEYPEKALKESLDEFSVRKFGRRISLFWEAMVNDDMDAFARNPERLARAARRSESKFATELWVEGKGPNKDLYKDEFNNIVKIEGKQPALSIESLEQALIQLSEQVDEDGEPINIDMVTLVAGPALRVTAMNILNALQIDTNIKGGSDKVRLRVENWMKNEVQLQIEPYIPHVADEENGNTMWALFASPQTGRPALDLGFLRGYEEPSLYERAPNARRIGGGGDVNESFEDDSVAWRIRHVLGGTRLISTGGHRATVASNGSGK